MTTIVARERPALAGVYPVADATALIQATHPAKLPADSERHRNTLDRINSRHIYRWIRDGMAGDYLVGLKGNEVALTFLDLVSLRLISVLRAHGITSAEIRRTHRGLQEARGWTHPFAMEPIWISGLGIYIREHDLPAKLDRNKNWQAALDFMELYIGPIHRLAFDEDEQAVSWEPEEGIVLDPKISFGEPCLSGTRIATQTLWALHAGGDPTERIAQAYELPVEKVETALAWERKLGYNGAG